MSETQYAGGVMAEKTAALVLPILADLGLELYDCEHQGGIVRVTVTRPADAADRSLDLDAIALVTRLLSRELDHSDPFPGKYTLEVTSPGLERTLRRPDHFATAIGQVVSVRLTGPVEGSRRYQGMLRSVDERGITVQLDDIALSEHHFTFAQIERARTVFVWGPAPKPGKGTGAPKGATRANRSAAPAATPDSDPTTQEADAS